MRREPAARLDRKAQSLLREVSRALLTAIAESATVNASLRRLQEQGYILHVLLDCEREEGREGGEQVPPDPTRDVAFRIDASDLAFLRSIGIDPTRRRRRPRSGTS